MRSNFILGFLLLATFSLGYLTANHIAAAKDAPRTAVVADQKAHIIRFIIDGQEQAVIDPHGLHVKNDIDYNGVITDGSSYFAPPSDKPVTERSHAR